jgi:polysaccharide export outer membrane protein
MRLVLNFLFIGFLALTSLSISACSTSLPYTPQASQNAPYILGSGDTVRIEVPLQTEISGKYTLNDEGDIDLPLIGRVNLNGMTVTQADQLISEMYANGYLVNPDINIQMDGYRPFFIMGEVENPGQYDYKDGLTVLNAVAIAGGFTYRANQEEFELVRRAGAENSQEGAPKLAAELATTVRPGDTIYVKERLF